MISPNTNASRLYPYLLEDLCIPTPQNLTTTTPSKINRLANQDILTTPHKLRQISLPNPQERLPPQNPDHTLDIANSFITLEKSYSAQSEWHILAILSHTMHLLVIIEDQLGLIATKTFPNKIEGDQIAMREYVHDGVIMINNEAKLVQSICRALCDAFDFVYRMAIQTSQIEEKHFKVWTVYCDRLPGR